MEILMGRDGEKTKPIQSQSVKPLDVGEELPDCSKPVSRSRAGRKDGENRQIARSG